MRLGRFSPNWCVNEFESEHARRTSEPARLLRQPCEPSRAVWLSSPSICWGGDNEVAAKPWWHGDNRIIVAEFVSARVATHLRWHVICQVSEQQSARHRAEDSRHGEPHRWYVRRAHRLMWWDSWARSDSTWRFKPMATIAFYWFWFFTGLNSVQPHVVVYTTFIHIHLDFDVMHITHWPFNWSQSPNNHFPRFSAPILHQTS